MNTGELIDMKQKVFFVGYALPTDLKMLLCDMAFSLHNGEGIETIRNWGDGSKKHFRRAIVQLNQSIPLNVRDSFNDVADSMGVSFEWFYDKRRGADNLRVTVEVEQ